jgi:Major intrinsic protein
MACGESGNGVDGRPPCGSTCVRCISGSCRPIVSSNQAANPGSRTVFAARTNEAVPFCLRAICDLAAAVKKAAKELNRAVTVLGSNDNPDLIIGRIRGKYVLFRQTYDGELCTTPWAGFVIEAVLGFFLVTVVLSTAVAGRAGNLAPLAIGMTLTLNIIMGGALTGAAFNPARALGPMVATGNFSDAWLYLAAPIVGAIVAAIVHTGLVRLAHEGMAAAAARTPAE